MDYAPLDTFAPDVDYIVSCNTYSSSASLLINNDPDWSSARLRHRGAIIKKSPI